jgi:hypothetical protein
MGYSARYHAASMAAIFLALAIGILIGSEFGDDVVSGAQQNLEESLTGDLEAARDRADELEAELSSADDFSERIYPALVEERLGGRRIGVLALGGLPDGVSNDIEDALDPTEARLVAVGVVREPVEPGPLATELEGSRFADIEANEDTAQALGTGVGRQLVLGGPLLNRIRDRLFSRSSGRFADLDGLVVVRDQPEDMKPDERSATERLETGLLDGIEATAVTAVGAEREDTEPSSISVFEAADLASVDNVDRVAGKVALVFALLGAQGSFGTKDTADQLLPDLLAPSPPVIEGDALAPGSGSGNGGGATDGQQGNNTP